MSDLSKAIVIQNLFGPEADLDSLAWKPFREGVEMIHLYGDPRTGPSAALLRYGEGAQLPLHQHTGYEHILILRASQQDQNGLSSAGTLVINSPGTSHTVYSAKGCVVLAIWEKPVQFAPAQALDAAASL